MSKYKESREEQKARLRAAVVRIDTEIERYENDPSSGPKTWREGMIKARKRERLEVTEALIDLDRLES